MIKLQAQLTSTWSYSNTEAREKLLVLFNRILHGKGLPEDWQKAS
jgi:hypothetical protein